MNFKDIKDLLEVKVKQYNRPDFIVDDPIAIPHSFHQKEDIEISGFLVATIAWGKRNMIIKNGFRLMELMDQAPYDFITHAQDTDIAKLKGFVHRTFQFQDLSYFIKTLQRMYQYDGGLENVFSLGATQKERIVHFHQYFFQPPFPQRTVKHVANPAKGSAAKRLNMFLRWMVRNDKCGVDFGLWKQIPMADLHCPLDVHTGNIARKLGLINRKPNDWKAVEELQGHLVRMDPLDPCKYDFALFSLGNYENF